MGYGAEAGISGFHKWFVRAFPSAVSDASHPRQQESFDHVCIDMNQILHVALRRAADEDHAIRRIYRDVNRVLKRFPPRRSVVFAFDGSAPIAKLVVQRQRRENSRRNAKYSMSALHLSPGTKFMEAVARAMEYYAFQECTRPCYERVKFYISGADVPGEGELKCIDWLKRMSNEGSENENAVIVGGDADLILQGLALTEVKNTFICSPTDAGSFRLSSMWEVVRSLEETFPGQSEFVRNDLAVLIMFNGNDYLPKVRGVSFDRCFQSYTSLKKGRHRDNFLIDGESRSICWEFLADLLADMLPGIAADAKGDGISLEQMDLNNRYPPAGSLFNAVVQQGKLGDGVEVQIDELSDADSHGIKMWRSSTWVRGTEYSWTHTAAKKKAVFHEAAAKLLEILVPETFEKFLEQEKARLLEQAKLDEKNDGIDLEDVADKKPLFDVEQYLKGVLWNLQMYIDGFVPNYYWIYSLRYSPSVADMLVWIQDGSPESLAKVSSPVTQAPPLPAAIACMCMIPMSEAGRAFLPERLQPLVQPGSPLLQGMISLDIPKILRVVQEQAPDELRDFHVGSHSSYIWKQLTGINDHEYLRNEQNDSGTPTELLSSRGRGRRSRRQRRTDSEAVVARLGPDSSVQAFRLGGSSCQVARGGRISPCDYGRLMDHGTFALQPAGREVGCRARGSDRGRHRELRMAKKLYGEALSLRKTRLRSQALGLFDGIVLKSFGEDGVSCPAANSELDRVVSSSRVVPSPKGMRRQESYSRGQATHLGIPFLPSNPFRDEMACSSFDPDGTDSMRFVDILACLLVTHKPEAEAFLEGLQQTFLGNLGAISSESHADLTKANRQMSKVFSLRLQELNLAHAYRKKMIIAEDTFTEMFCTAFELIDEFNSQMINVQAIVKRTLPSN
eukprot:g9763.t2